jgi:hypothetical protein
VHLRCNLDDVERCELMGLTGRSSEFGTIPQRRDTVAVAISLLTDEELRMMTSADLRDLIRMSHTMQSTLVATVSFSDCEWPLIHDFALIARDLCRLGCLMKHQTADERPAFSMN